MIIPIFPKLRECEKFDFATLADNPDDVEEFWEWWWAERYKDGIISRPLTISDDDPILQETLNKTTADLASFRECFGDFLFNATKPGKLPAKNDFPRTEFRELLTRIVGANSTVLSGRPQIVFAGGGYGSGKTTVLSRLTQAGVLPLGREHMVGVDYFKLYVPEFNLIQAVADGRASGTVQKECYQLAAGLFDRLVAEGRSFIWDSSMSDRDETMKRIQQARSRDYELAMIAVLTPVELATRQAMKRAKETRRFPNAEALPKSHLGFRKTLMDYVPLFDEVTVFANLTGEGDIPIVAEKASGANGLALLDATTFNYALSVPEAQ
ncbi:MAG: hypothetical protein EBS05_25390 [Proteobacteria bacterium]|nr:hypothetical protein [Pseudomonadota bacterium]